MVCLVHRCGMDPPVASSLAPPDLGLPVLLFSQSFPGTLCVDIGEQSPGRALPKVRTPLPLDRVPSPPHRACQSIVRGTLRRPSDAPHSHSVLCFCRSALPLLPCSYTTLEYALPRAPSLPPSYLFVVDICLEESEVGFVKTSLTQALSLLPENALVGLITFGAQVQVHELGFQECPKSFVFRGAKEYTSVQIQDQLQFPRGGMGRPGAPGNASAATAAGIGRFMLPLADCEFQVRFSLCAPCPSLASLFAFDVLTRAPIFLTGAKDASCLIPQCFRTVFLLLPVQLNSVLEDLQRDPFQPLPEQRQSRCTGSALNVAAGLLQAGLSGQPAHIVLFVGGPATEGSGQIVAKELAESVRSHKDIKKDGAPYYKKAKKYYEVRRFLSLSLSPWGIPITVACALHFQLRISPGLLAASFEPTGIKTCL